MNLQQRKELLVRLGNYMVSEDPDWLKAKEKASGDNLWFIPEFINLSARNISTYFLQPGPLKELADRYQIPETNSTALKIGIVMAGNIPLVGFHDLLCVFIAGHHAMIKPSSKDETLIRHLSDKLKEWVPETEALITVSERIPNCDAYIATGSNNASRYFDYYFSKYPHIIRRNRTSVALLSGKESREELLSLADDVYQYFGLGCRNVTKVYVPKNYDFLPLLEAFKKYDHLTNYHKYKNNYDYNLAVHILNNKYYMTNGSIILVENDSPFSPISQLHYQYYSDSREVLDQMRKDENIQCLVGPEDTGFGKAQLPGICDFADGVDTMKFLMSLG